MSTIREVAAFLRTVPETKFDMRTWLEVPTGEAGASFTAVTVQALRSYVEPDAAKRRYACVTSACVAGWAVLHAEQVAGESMDEGGVIEYAALDYLTRDVRESDRHHALSDALENLFYDTSIETPDEAAGLLLDLAEEHGL